MTNLEDVQLINTFPAMAKILVDYMNETHPDVTVFKIETKGDSIHVEGRVTGTVHFVTIGGTVV